jgi:hypothetical protein
MNRCVLAIATAAMSIAVPVLAQTTTPDSSTTDTSGTSGTSSTTAPAATPAPSVAPAPPDAAAPGTAQSTGTSATSGTSGNSSSSAAQGSSETAAPTSEAPGNVIQSPVETNRLDPSAPSRQRLQIDEGQLGSTVTNPDETSSNPAAPGESYNSIVEGAPSNNGIGTGTSGLGTTSAPQSTYPKRLTSPPTPFSNQFGNSLTPGTGTTFRPSTGLNSGSSLGMTNRSSFGHSLSGGHSGGLR